MSKDIRTMYTRQCNKQDGRRIYCGWKKENETVIPPNKYGEFVNQKGKRK